MQAFLYHRLAALLGKLRFYRILWFLTILLFCVFPLLQFAATPAWRIAAVVLYHVSVPVFERKKTGKTVIENVGIVFNMCFYVINCVPSSKNCAQIATLEVIVLFLQSRFTHSQFLSLFDKKISKPMTSQHGFCQSVVHTTLLNGTQNKTAHTH